MISRDMIRKTGKTLYLHLSSSCSPTSASIEIGALRRIELMNEAESGHVDLIATMGTSEVIVARFPTQKAAARVQSRIMNCISLSPWRWPKRMAIAFGVIILLSALASATNTASVQMPPIATAGESTTNGFAIDAPNPFGGAAAMPSDAPTPRQRLKLPEIKVPELNCDVPLQNPQK